MTSELNFNTMPLSPLPDDSSTNYPVPQSVGTNLPSLIHLVLSDGIAEFMLSPANPIIVGRSSPDQIVTVDLSKYNARDLGISRQHVRIEAYGDKIVVRDLDSVNGTRLNGVVLKAGTVHNLKDRDTLKLGSVKMQVFFIY